MLYDQRATAPSADIAKRHFRCRCALYLARKSARLGTEANKHSAISSTLLQPKLQTRRGGRVKIGNLVKFMDLHGKWRIATIVAPGAAGGWWEIACDGLITYWPEMALEVIA